MLWLSIVREMADVAGVFQRAREGLAGFLRSLNQEQLNTEVPATPGWTIRDIAAHLAGDATSVIDGDLPQEFFEAFGQEDAVVSLNRWTTAHVEDRADRSIEEILDEWDGAAQQVISMMRGDTPWPEGVPFFGDRVLLTDLGAHQQDIYGALGVKKDRDGPLVRLGTAGYVAMMGFRLPGAQIPPLRVRAGDSERVTGTDEPGATVRADRFEMFRALSGRRSPDQIRAFDWDGDPEPYIPYFYPYGIREQALIE
jgi:uncharacterized protein (TIGR03083 family)